MKISTAPGGLAAAAGILLGLVLWTGAPVAQVINAVPGMPSVVDPKNLYSETRADKLNPAVAAALPRVYVPNRQSNDVHVIDPATFKVVDRFRVGIHPQHSLVGSQDALGHQQRRGADRRQPHADRSHHRETGKEHPRR